MPKVLDLAIGRRTCRVARQTALAGLQELFGPSVIKALGSTFTAAQLGNAGLAAQAIQNYPDLLFGRMTLAGCPADVLHDPLRRRFRAYGFLSHLHSLMVTMSQKSSVPQAAKSVSQVLIPDSPSSSTGTAEARSPKAAVQAVETTWLFSTDRGVAALPPCGTPQKPQNCVPGAPRHDTCR